MKWWGIVGLGIAYAGWFSWSEGKKIDLFSGSRLLVAWMLWWGSWQ